jgi:hypothetical protein
VIEWSPVNDSRSGERRAVRQVTDAGIGAGRV